MNKKTRILTLLVGVFFLVLFYFFSREVKQGFLKQTDFNLTVRLQDNMPKRFDEVWEDIAFFVTPTSSIGIIGLLTIIAFTNKKIRFRALIIPLLFAALIMGEMYGKSVVHHPAPPFFMIKNPTSMFPKYYINEQYSYPSGHTARAVFLGIVALSLVRRKRMMAAAGLATFVFLIAIGRIYLGHHWLSDIMGGTFLAASIGSVAYGLLSPDA